MDIENICKFIAEIGVLKRVKRSGWWNVGIKDPESVADHSFRTAIIGYILAEMENVDTEKVCVMCLLHDIAEARVGDLNKIAARYINRDKEEKIAFKDQMERLPDKISKGFSSLYEEMFERKTKEAIVAKDADYLECAIQAKEYVFSGNKDAQKWVINAKKAVKTESAKKILEFMDKKDSHFWWEGLKKMPRE